MNGRNSIQIKYNRRKIQKLKFRTFLPSPASPIFLSSYLCQHLHQLPLPSPCGAFDCPCHPAPHAPPRPCSCHAVSYACFHCLLCHDRLFLPCDAGDDVQGRLPSTVLSHPCSAVLTPVPKITRTQVRTCMFL